MTTATTAPMQTASTTAPPFRLQNAFRDPLRRALMDALRPALERALFFPTLNGLYADLARRRDERHFSEKALAALGITVDVQDDDLARIPASGPLLVVANHPFGGADGLALLALLRRARTDVKLLGNAMLRAVPDLADVLIPVDAFGGRGSEARNLGPLREAIRWVRSGGALAVFPAGEVSHLTLAARSVADSPWSDAAAGLALRAGAPVLPVHFDGRNSTLFQMAGLAHPILRTLLLPRELLRRRRSVVTVRVGNLIPSSRLAEFESAGCATEYMRVRTEILAGRMHTAARCAEKGARGVSRGDAQPADLDEPAPSGNARGWSGLLPLLPTPPSADARSVEPIAAPVPAELLAREIAALPDSQRLLESGPYDVLYARAVQCPAVLREIGRLREISFRQAGEGTGKASDLDRFDEHYLHLFVWNRETDEIVGAYRMGPTDEILPLFGRDGLYTSTLFHYKRALLDQIGPALELGRSFVRPEYQKTHSALGLLWKGIGRFVAERPRYKRLFGPVSISNEYQSMTRQLLMVFLQVNRSLSGLGRFLRPRNPARPGPLPQRRAHAASTVVRDLGDVEVLVREIEDDRRTIPVLLRQYLKLNGVLLGFNVDPDFGDVLDGLMLADMTQVSPAVLVRYMGKEGAADFLAHHGRTRE